MKRLNMVDGGDPVTLSLAEQVARYLTAAIASGKFKPGETLGEQALSEMFKVSRAPIREALRILERDGVVEITPRKGARVTALSHQELIEVYEIRAVLFGLATKQFAICRTPELLAKVKQGVSQLSALVEGNQAGDQYGQQSADIARLIIDSCDGKRLAPLIHQFDYQISRYRHLGLVSVEMRRKSLAMWRKLVSAFDRRDADGAEALGRAIIMRTRDAAEPQFAAEPTLAKAETAA